MSKLVRTHAASITAVIVVCGLLLSGCDRMTRGSNEITAYPIKCTADLVNGKCPIGRALPLNPTTYTVWPDQQFVVGELVGTITRYTNCVIVDVSNWECSYTDDSGTFGVTGGQFWDRAKPERVSPKYIADTPRYFYTSKQDYERFMQEFRE
jgi:hypothetical protein